MVHFVNNNPTSTQKEILIIFGCEQSGWKWIAIFLSSSSCVFWKNYLNLIIVYFPSKKSVCISLQVLKEQLRVRERFFLKYMSSFVPNTEKSLWQCPFNNMERNFCDLNSMITTPNCSRVSCRFRNASVSSFGCFLCAFSSECFVFKFRGASVFVFECFVLCNTTENLVKKIWS